MNAHALAVLEFPRLLEFVAGRATTELGAERVRSLVPTTDRERLDREHSRVSAVRSAIAGDTPWHPAPVPDLRTALGRLRIEGVAWTGAELLAAAQLLRSSRLTRDALTDSKRPAIVIAVLGPLVSRLLVAKAEEERIERTLLDDGTVRDDASAALRRIRRELRAAHGELIRILERAMERLESHHRVADASVTVRNGRYVIPVRREGRVVVGGLVHDVSQTGGTLFVEPPAAIEFGNRIRELEGEEVEEVDRILRFLTAELRPHRDALADTLDVLAELDGLYARARYAQEFACASAELSPARRGFALLRARHPLLLARAGVEGSVVPFDLAMEEGERTLLVSGPNTGGKTVLLKAVGIISAMAQSGIPAPVDAASRIPMFDDIYADVGDEQSIEASLSTFSAHLKNLSEILRLATGDSLVLIDELGSGTDPTEGAALGWAILEELTRRGTTTVATTHLGTLKELATQVDAVVNASLQFDAVRLAPTYRLIKGVPGRSYGISIARRLALPEAVVARAEERVPQQERDMAALLEQLERREAELAVREHEASAIADDARRRIHDVARREQIVRTRERESEKESRQEARRYLLDARAEIDRTIKQLREAGAAGAATLDEQGRAARRAAEELAQRQGVELDRLDREEANAARRAQVSSLSRDSRPAGPPTAGDSVEVATLGGKRGRVMEIRGREAVVAVGALKLTVPVSTLVKVAHVPAEAAVTVVGDISESEARSEIDLRGMRVDDVDSAVMQALDDAIRADLRSLRIIHGKGTGALRAQVTALLRKDTRIATHRLGAWNEGGTGVTVVELR